MRSLTSNNDATELIKAARAGRVAHTGFLAPDEAAQLVAKLRQADTSVNVSGGFPGAIRRIITVFPETMPNADTQLAALYAEAVHDEGDFRAALHQHLESAAIGDVIKHQEGSSVIILEKVKTSLPAELNVRGQRVTLEQVPLDHVVKGSRKRQMVIVPSLRVDALGAKAFNVSRSYFAKGIKAGNVLINGAKASKSSSAEAGDEIYAETIGRMYIASVQGETRRGNLKVLVDIEKS